MKVVKNFYVILLCIVAFSCSHDDELLTIDQLNPVVIERPESIWAIDSTGLDIKTAVSTLENNTDEEGVE